MNKPEPFSKPLPADGDVMVKLSEPTAIIIERTVVFNYNGSPYTSAYDIVSNCFNSIITNTRPPHFLEQGIKASILEPGKKWVSGNIRLRLVVEFIPDEPENGGTRPRSTDAVLGGQ